LKQWFPPQRISLKIDQMSFKDYYVGVEAKEIEPNFGTLSDMHETR